MPENNPTPIQRALAVLDWIEELIAAAKTQGTLTVDTPADDDLFTWIRNERGEMLSGTSGRFWISDARATVAKLNAHPSLSAVIRAQAAYIEALEGLVMEGMKHSELADETEYALGAALLQFAESGRS